MTRNSTVQLKVPLNHSAATTTLQLSQIEQKLFFFQRELRFHEKTTPLIVSKNSIHAENELNVQTVIFQQAIRLLAESKMSFDLKLGQVRSTMSNDRSFSKDFIR